MVHNPVAFGIGRRGPLVPLPLLTIASFPQWIKGGSALARRCRPLPAVLYNAGQSRGQEMGLEHRRDW